MGVVVQPLPELVFDGSILMKRISEKKVGKKVYNQSFSDNAILNYEQMGGNGGQRVRVHDNTLTFSGLYQQMAGYYELDYFMSICIMFTYKSYRDRVIDKKSNLLSGEGIIQDHWIQENRIARRQAITLSELELRLNSKIVTSMRRTSNVIPSSCLE